MTAPAGPAETAAHLPILLDLLGIFVSASSGAIVGLRKGLDLVGILVLGVVTGLGGGMIRDTLIGAVPPTALTDTRYIASGLLAGCVVIAVDALPRQAATRGYVERVRHRIPLTTAATVADAAALAVFAVAGTLKAIDYGLGMYAAALLGVVTATGGGVIRDVLVGEVPFVLRRELYAIPALLGALVIVVCHRDGFDGEGPAAIAAAATFGLRMIAVGRDWHAPRPGAR